MSSLTTWWNRSRKLENRGTSVSITQITVMNKYSLYIYLHSYLCIFRQLRHLLWVQLVDGSVNPNCDLQGVLATSLTHQVDDPSEACATHMSRASGDALTDQPNNVTVQLRGKNSQRGEDVVDLLPVPRITGKPRKGYILQSRSEKHILPFLLGFVFVCVFFCFLFLET